MWSHCAQKIACVITDKTMQCVRTLTQRSFANRCVFWTEHCRSKSKWGYWCTLGCSQTIPKTSCVTVVKKFKSFGNLEHAGLWTSIIVVLVWPDSSPECTVPTWKLLGLFAQIEREQLLQRKSQKTKPIALVRGSSLVIDRDLPMYKQGLEKAGFTVQTPGHQNNAGPLTKNSSGKFPPHLHILL